MILLDANVLVYALGTPHPLQESSERVLEAIRDGRVRAGTIDAVYIEFLHAFSRRRPRALAAAAARAYVELLGPPLDIVVTDRELALDLFERHERLSPVDAVLAAVAARTEIEALVTPDADFGSVPEIRVLDPRSPELEMLLDQ